MPNGQKYEDWLKDSENRLEDGKNNARSSRPGLPTEAREKPGRSGRGKVQKAPGLTIDRIVVPE